MGTKRRKHERASKMEHLATSARKAAVLLGVGANQAVLSEEITERVTDEPKKPTTKVEHTKPALPLKQRKKILRKRQQ